MTVRRCLGGSLFLFLITSFALTPDLLSADQDPTKSVDELTTQLISEKQEVADAAKRELVAMGPAVVKQLFEKLLVADWTLKPRLLEVLSAHGREFAKQKLVKGNETEKVYAALVFELSVSCAADDFHYDSPEFKAMVAALLTGIKSDNKHLRAAAAAALIYDDHSTIWFEHFHEIVPALISSFDTHLIIDRRNRGGPVHVVSWLLAVHLDGLIEDRLAYSEMEEKWSREAQIKPDVLPTKRPTMEEVLADKAADIDELRSYWVTWWRGHASLTPKDIGIQIMDRNVRIIQDVNNSFALMAEGSAEKWAGSGVATFDLPKWWALNRKNYRGPIRKEP